MRGGGFEAKHPGDQAALGRYEPELNDQRPRLRVHALSAQHFAEEKVALEAPAETPLPLQFSGDAGSPVERRRIEELRNVASLYVRVRTSGDGACGFHGAFGQPNTATSRKELFRCGARSAAE